MPRTEQPVLDDTANHPTDPYLGRSYRHTSGRTVQIRLLTEADVADLWLSGRPGVDYRVQCGKDDAYVIKPEQYALYSVVPRSAYELDAIRLYDWLQSQDVLTISNTDVFTNKEAHGVGVMIIPGPNPPSTALVYMPVRGDNVQGTANHVVGLLSNLGIVALIRPEPAGLTIQFHPAELDLLPS